MSKNVAISVKSEGLVLSGYQKKLKTMKKKYFVLYKETCSSIARLEYYDTEKKFKQGLEPKRVIKLKNCFNINRRLDTKYAFVLALSTTDGGFGIVLDNEADLQKWMDVLLSLQKNSTIMSDIIYPVFEHVWQVNIQKKGIAEEKGVVGYYHVCLTSKSLTLISFRPEKTLAGDKRVPNVEFLLTTIRRCGDSHCFFYIEVGRQSILGPGELWMETKDVLIAQNMHKMILSAMSVKTESNLDVTTVNQAVKIESIVEPMRKRSSSATEASKPISFFPKLQLSTDIKFNSSQSTLHNFGRERCDSLPTRNRILNECNNLSSRSTRSNTISGPRPYSYQKNCSSPPLNTLIASKSEESSIFIDEPGDIGTCLPYRLNARSKDGVIPEENTDEINVAEVKGDDLNKRKDSTQDIYISMAPVKALSHCIDSNEWHPTNQSRSLDESKRTSSLLMVNHESTGLQFEFPEHISEKVSRNSEIEINCDFVL